MSDPAALVALQRALYASRNPTRRYLHCARRDWIYAQLQRCERTSLALEVGPGSGVYLPMLAEVADTVLAVDQQAAYLLAARQQLATDVDAAGDGIAYVQADLRAMPIAPGSIDILLCSEVLEHIPDSAQLLLAMAKLLTPEGRLVLTTPQPFSPLELLGKIAFLPGLLQLLRWIYREPIEPTGHINLLRRKALQAQFARAGLAVEGDELLGLYLPLVGEFGGVRGQRLLAWLEPRIRATPLRFLLWTQCYVLRHA